MALRIDHRLPVLLDCSPPPTRGDCIKGTPTTGSRDARMQGRAQCMALRCPHNLLVEHSSDRPGRPHNGLRPDWTVNGDTASSDASCTLDLADQGPMSTDAIAKALKTTRRRVQQILKKRKAESAELARMSVGGED